MATEQPRKGLPKRATNPAQPTSSDEYTGMFFIDPAMLDTENYYYSWVEQSVLGEETLSIDNAMRKGYEPVKISDHPAMAEKMDVLARIKGKQAGNEFIQRGNQTFMRCPIELYNQRRDAERRENKKKMSGVDLHALTSMTGAPAYVDKNLTTFSRTKEHIPFNDE